MKDSAWECDKEETVVYRRISNFGNIEIQDGGDTVSCSRSNKTWSLFDWKVRGDGFTITGTARSLERAKEDSIRALQTLAPIDFETATPLDSERDG